MAAGELLKTDYRGSAFGGLGDDRAAHSAQTNNRDVILHLPTLTRSARFRHDSSPVAKVYDLVEIN